MCDRYYVDADILLLLRGGSLQQAGLLERPAQAQPEQPLPFQRPLKGAGGLGGTDTPVPEPALSPAPPGHAAAPAPALPPAAAGRAAPSRWAAFRACSAAGAPATGPQPPGTVPAVVAAPEHSTAGPGSKAGGGASNPACSAGRAAGPERYPASASKPGATEAPSLPPRRPLHPAAVRRGAPGGRLEPAVGSPGSLAPGLRFPSALETAAPPRRVCVPDAFDQGPAQYERVLSAAVIEELNLRLAALARRFHAARQQLQCRAAHAAPAAGAMPAAAAKPSAGALSGRAKAGSVPGSRGGRGIPLPRICRIGSRMGGRAGAGAGVAVTGAQLQRACRAAHLVFFAECILSVCSLRGGSGGRGEDGHGGGRGGGGGGESRRASPAVYLTLGGGGGGFGGGPGAGARLVFRKDDLWVIGSGAELEGLTTGRPADRLAGPWVALARSCWHGPSREGRCAPWSHAWHRC